MRTSLARFRAFVNGHCCSRRWANTFGFCETFNSPQGSKTNAKLNKLATRNAKWRTPFTPTHNSIPHKRAMWRHIVYLVGQCYERNSLETNSVAAVGRHCALLGRGSNADDRCGWHFTQMKTTAKLQCSQTLFAFDVKLSAVWKTGDFTIACVDKTSCYLGPFLERSHSGRAMTHKSPRRWQMLRGSRATSHNLKWQRPAYSSRRTVHIVTRQLGRLFAPVPLTATAYTLISNRFSDLWPPALYGRNLRVVLYHHSRKEQRYAPTASQGTTEHLLQQLYCIESDK